MDNSPNFKDFAACALETADTRAKRVVVFAYFRSKFAGGSATLLDIADDFSTAGLGTIRKDVVRGVLTSDRRVRRIGTDRWMIPSDRFFDIEREFELDRCMPTKISPKLTPRPASKAKTVPRKGGSFVDEKRIKELRKIISPDYDLTRLIRICIEINDNFSRQNYTSTVLLLRALLDHVAPIFGFPTFIQVANNFQGSKSLKDSLQHLENSSRKISDGHLHTPIRKKEVLPTATQVNFSQDLDVLLGEIIRLLK